MKTTNAPERMDSFELFKGLATHFVEKNLEPRIHINEMLLGFLKSKGKFRRDKNWSWTWLRKITLKFFNLSQCNSRNFRRLFGSPGLLFFSCGG